MRLPCPARAPKGKRANGDCAKRSAGGNRPQQRGKNVSIIGAIGLDGVIAQYSILGAMDFHLISTQLFSGSLTPISLLNLSFTKGSVS